MTGDDPQPAITKDDLLSLRDFDTQRTLFSPITN